MLDIENKIDYDENGFGLLTGREFNLLVDNINKIIEENGDVATYEESDQLFKAIDGFVKKNIYKNIGNENELTLIKQNRNSIGTLESYSEGMSFFFTVNENNTSSVTMKVNSLESKQLLFPDGSELPSGTLTKGHAYFCVYTEGVFNVFLINKIINYSTDTENAALVDGDETQTYKIGAGTGPNDAIRKIDIDNKVDTIIQNGLPFINFMSNDGSYKISLEHGSIIISKMDGNNEVNKLTIRLKDSTSIFTQNFIFKEDGIYIGDDRVTTSIDDKFTIAYTDPNRTYKLGERYVNNDGILSVLLKKDNDNSFFTIGGINGTTGSSGGSNIFNSDIVKYISNNMYSTFIIDDNDKVLATGDNDDGQLGLGDTTDRDTFTDTGKVAKYVTNGDYSTFIIDDNNKVWSCGYNNYGQLGLGDTSNRNDFIDTGKTAKYIINNNDHFTYIVDMDDKVWSTGYNDDGQLGLGDTTNRDTFTDTGKTAKYVFNGSYGCGFIIDMDDKLWATGLNDDGQLGLGDTTNRDTFTDTGMTAKYVNVGRYYTFIIDMDNKVWATGDNNDGQLGLGDTANRDAFTDTGKVAKYVSTSNDYSTFIIDMDDKLWATGQNDYGQLGLGDTTNRNAFTDTGKLSKYITNDYDFVFIIDMDDKIWSTGNNQYGELGLGDTTDRSTFTDTGKVAKYMSNGYHTAFIIDMDDRVWSVGYNDKGQLGLGDTTNRNVFTDTGKILKD